MYYFYTFCSLFTNIFDIYSKWRKKMSEKSMKNVTLKELIQNIDFKLNHIEDIEADNRKLK